MASAALLIVRSKKTLKVQGFSDVAHPAGSVHFGPAGAFAQKPTVLNEVEGGGLRIAMGLMSYFLYTIFPDSPGFSGKITGH
jgi:hypothetical protein